MSDRSKESTPPTPQADARVKEIWQALSDSFHVIEDDELAQARGITKEEHARRHYLFAWAFMIGMEYTATHPRRATRLIRDKAAGKDDEVIFVDQISEAILYLFPQAKLDPNRILAMKEGYGQTSGEVVKVKPVFDDRGMLSWEETDSFPFDWEYELETWEDSSE